MDATQSAHRLPMSEAEYLAFTDEQEVKHEYRRGQVYAMTGASVRHNTITANTIMHIGGRLADRDCTVTTSDTRIHIDSKQVYRYPDVTGLEAETLFPPLGRRNSASERPCVMSCSVTDHPDVRC